MHLQYLISCISLIYFPVALFFLPQILSIWSHAYYKSSWHLYTGVQSCVYHSGVLCFPVFLYWRWKYICGTPSWYPNWPYKHRRTGRGVRGGSWPPNSGRYMTFIRAKDNTFVWLTVSPRTEQVSIYLRYISGGVTKETFIGYSLRPSKTGSALVHYCFFSLAGPRDKQVVFAIRAKLGLTPQMDVRPYAYAYKQVSKVLSVTVVYYY